MTAKQKEKQGGAGDRLRYSAYLRRGLGEGSPRGGSIGQLGFVVDSDLRGGGRGTVWRRRRALVPFCRGVVTVEARQEDAVEGGPGI